MTENAAVKYPKTAAALGSAGEVVVISQEIAEYISDTKAPQGLFAIAEKPHSDGIPDGARAAGAPGRSAGPRQCRDDSPDRRGAGIRRRCAIAGVRRYLGSPKTLRASMGSVFRLPCITGELPGIISGLKEMGFRVYGSMLDSSAAKLGELEFPEARRSRHRQRGAPGISRCDRESLRPGGVYPDIRRGIAECRAPPRRYSSGAVKALNDIFKLDMTCPAYPHMSAV